MTDIYCNPGRLFPVFALALGLLFSMPARADMQLASAAAPRFIPLSAAARQAPVRFAQPVARPTLLRSDAAAIQGGFLRIDRARAAPIHRVTRLNPPNKTSQKRNDDALAMLNSVERDVTETPLFRDTVKKMGEQVAHSWPLPIAAKQRLSSNYGVRKDPFTKKHKFHEGIDLAAPKGTSVIASADGVVSDVGSGKGFGKFVSVIHRDGSESIYGHLSAQAVHQGQRVQQGQKLGAVGNTGRSTGAHLHYQLEQHGRPMNPLAALTPPSSVRVAMRAK